MKFLILVLISLFSQTYSSIAQDMFKCVQRNAKGETYRNIIDNGHHLLDTIFIKLQNSGKAKVYKQSLVRVPYVIGTWTQTGDTVRIINKYSPSTKLEVNIKKLLDCPDYVKYPMNKKGKILDSLDFFIIRKNASSLLEFKKNILYETINNKEIQLCSDNLSLCTNFFITPEKGCYSFELDMDNFDGTNYATTIQTISLLRKGKDLLKLGVQKVPVNGQMLD